MRATVSIAGNDLLCRTHEGDERETRIPLVPGDLAAWAARYEVATRRDDATALFTIGAEIFAWLDVSGWASSWVRGGGERALEVRVEHAESPEANALLDLPWELLANGGKHFAMNEVQPFVVVRSIGRGLDATPAEPPHDHLSILFMAASPRGVMLSAATRVRQRADVRVRRTSR